uniref:Uncharacterized protein n=1 Tax=Aegilops tauschii subsp. strangulata TaxID=200361 RepID=A0A453LVU7_AEGTS
ATSLRVAMAGSGQFKSQPFPFKFLLICVCLAVSNGAQNLLFVRCTCSLPSMLTVAVCVLLTSVLRQQVRGEVLQGEPARRLPQVLRDMLRRVQLRAVGDRRQQGRVPVLPRQDHRPRRAHEAQVPMIHAPPMASTWGIYLPELEDALSCTVLSTMSRITTILYACNHDLKRLVHDPTVC